MLCRVIAGALIFLIVWHLTLEYQIHLSTSNQRSARFTTLLRIPDPLQQLLVIKNKLLAPWCRKLLHQQFDIMFGNGNSESDRIHSLSNALHRGSSAMAQGVMRCISMWPLIHDGMLRTRRQMDPVIEQSKQIYHRTIALPHAQVVLAAIATAAAMAAFSRCSRRFRTATEIPLEWYRHQRSLKGVIVAANDSDNVRFLHRNIWMRIAPVSFTRWALSPSWRQTSIKSATEDSHLFLAKQNWKHETINVRLAGIDAPEMGHFGGHRQPYAEEAKTFLHQLVQGRNATVQLHRIDQYARAVATVHIRKYWIFKQNVSLAMVEAGFATVYDSAGAEYGGIKDRLLAAERRAKRGMWKQTQKEYVSPAEHKRLLRALN